MSDPAWDMLLDLFVGHITGRDVSVTSACLASRRPATTSLRYIERMAKQGLIRREKDCNDNRKVYLRMTEKAFRAVAKWIDALRDELITA
ncbi:MULTISPECIES: winged helix DNA-binding protein [Pseudomonadota]|uniref:winged helix DNA-binding protein n=1 Tax=Pseudomonadota TaxID=1224 RepID=UPI000769BCD0|nr:MULTISPECIES: winged helix DNA-binding protein [Pseudomonadota]